nr:hypothetical protein Iba_chr04dCG11550 [Ipomoea batatas]
MARLLRRTHRHKKVAIFIFRRKITASDRMLINSYLRDDVGPDFNYHLFELFPNEELDSMSLEELRSYVENLESLARIMEELSN